MSTIGPQKNWMLLVGSTTHPGCNQRIPEAKNVDPVILVTEILESEVKLLVSKKSNILLGQWLNFKLFGITYLVGKIKFKVFFSGSIG